MPSDRGVHSSKVLRFVWFIGGMIAFGLGVVGIVLPVLPTTPFILLAAFCFARSSRRYHDWLVGHPIFGPVISNWHQYGAISHRAKFVAAGSMVLVFLLSVFFRVPTFVLIVQAVILGCVAIFVLSRPSPPQDS